jgi:hypothetical protein
VRRSRNHIKGGTFAQIIRAYLMSPKIEGLAPSTQAHYRYLLAFAETPETLGLLPVEVIRPALVQAFLDGLAGRPGLQRNAKAALKAVEKWAIVRDMLPHPITFGCEVEGSRAARSRSNIAGQTGAAIAWPTSRPSLPGSTSTSSSRGEPQQ